MLLKLLNLGNKKDLQEYDMKNESSLANFLKS